MASNVSWLVDQEEIMRQLQAAVALHNQGELDQAEVIYRNVLAVDKNNFYALRFSGCLRSSRGDYKSAISLLRHATSVLPSDSECWFNLGNAYKADFQLEEAIASYRSAEEHGSINAQVFNNWGRCLQDLSMQKESISVLEKAIGIDSSCFGAWFALANSWRDFKDFSKAKICYLKAINISPSFEDAYVNLGLMMKVEGEIEGLISIFQKIIKMKPGLAFAYIQLAICLHEESEIHDALSLYASALKADDQVSDCRLQLCAAGMINLANYFESIKSKITILFLHLDNLSKEDLLFLRCLCDFSEQWGMSIEFPAELSQNFSSQEISLQYSSVLDDLFGAYALCRESFMPRWIQFKDTPIPHLLLSDYLESLRVHGESSSEAFEACKSYQLVMMSADAEHLPAVDKLFVKSEALDERLWLSAERYQFPDVTAAYSLEESLLRKSSIPAVSRQDQSEFFRKAHLLDAQKFYMAKKDLCLHGVSELYRVHGLIADTLEDMEYLQSVVDLGYYSCGIFNAGLKADLEHYCIEPARHHAVWVADSEIAVVVPDVPERCVRSFDEHLSRLEAVVLGDSGSTAAVISFILQLFEYGQCVDMLQSVKRFASHLVITDDILNEESEESILRLLSNGKRMNLCHNYQRMLSDAGWEIEKKWYFHGVRYASGIIVASAA